MSPPGRPRGESGSREAILSSARALFAELGYERASIRAIARRASVDPALVHHYFGTKDELLRAAVQLPLDPGPIMVSAFGDREHVGESLVGALLDLWDTPDIRDRVLALLRAAVTHPGAAAILRNVLSRDILHPAAEHIDVPDAHLRAELAAAHLIGLAIARYILGFESLADTPAATISHAVGPTVQRYLTDPNLLAGAGPARGERASTARRRHQQRGPSSGRTPDVTPLP